MWCSSNPVWGWWVQHPGPGPCLHPATLSPFPLPTPSSASAPSAAPGPACSMGNDSERDLSCRNESSLLQPSSVPTALQPQTLSTKPSRAFASPGLLQAHPAAPTGILLRSPAAAGIPIQPSSSPGIPTEEFQLSLLAAGCPQDPQMVPATPCSALLPGHLPSQGSPWATPLWGHSTTGQGGDRDHPHSPIPTLPGALGCSGSSGNGK